MKKIYPPTGQPGANTAMLGNIATLNYLTAAGSRVLGPPYFTIFSVVFFALASVFLFHMCSRVRVFVIPFSFVRHILAPISLHPPLTELLLAPVLLILGLTCGIFAVRKKQRLFFSWIVITMNALTLAGVAVAVGLVIHLILGIH